MARPKAKIDERQVEKLASFGCTNTEIADVFGVDDSTIGKRFSKILAKGRGSLKQRLRKKQISVAMGGSAALLIWLGKQYLEQSDKQQISGDQSAPLRIEVVYVDGPINPAPPAPGPAASEAGGEALQRGGLRPALGEDDAGH
jgi:DNA-binding CsgD family transcriptional regulator